MLNFWKNFVDNKGNEWKKKSGSNPSQIRFGQEILNRNNNQRNSNGTKDSIKNTNKLRRKKVQKWMQLKDMQNYS